MEFRGQGCQARIELGANQNHHERWQSIKAAVKKRGVGTRKTIHEALPDYPPQRMRLMPLSKLGQTS